MNRYTKRGANGMVYGTGPATVCWGGRPVGERAFCVGCHGTKDNRDVDRSKCGPLAIIDRLAAYEDTGLEPEKVTELMAAHGTAILELSEYRSIGIAKHLLELARAEKDGRLIVLPCKPGQMVWAESPVMGRAYKFGAPDITWIIENTERFGREIFPTREEAEAALKKREGADNEAD